MSDIVVRKINESFVKVTTDDIGIDFEIDEYFAFRAKGFQFVPAFKHKKWDGYTRLFNKFSKTLYKGLLPHLKIFAEQNNYSFETTFDENIEVKYSKEKITEFCRSLEPLDENGDLLVHDEPQLNAIYDAINFKNKLVLSPTASGKSLIIYSILRWFQQFDKKQIIIVPTIALVHQMYSDFAEYSASSDWDAESNLHKIFSGQEKDTDKPIVITTWQSVFKLSENYFKPYDVVLCDEVHSAQAKSIRGIMERLTNADVRVGLTGTLGSSKTHHLILEGLFGKATKYQTSAKMMEIGRAAKLKINTIEVEYSDEDKDKLNIRYVDSEGKKRSRKMTYAEEVKFVETHEKRNNIIKNIVIANINKDKNVLVLCNHLSHGQVLNDMIKEFREKDIFFLSQKTSSEEKERIRKYVNENKGCVIIATYKLYSTGINIKNLHALVFAAFSKSEIRILQSIGRVLRKTSIKLTATLYDLTDDFRPTGKKKWTNYSLKHYLERLKIYNKEKFEYYIYKMKI